MPGEHGIVEKMIVIAGVAFVVIVVLYGLYLLVRFWMSFAEGINEANPKPKGFEVKVIEQEGD